MIGLALLNVAGFRAAGGAATGPVPSPAPSPSPSPAPASIIDTIVIEGDSITSTMPSTYAGDFYSYQFDDLRPDKTVVVRGQNSRSIGSPANLNDDSNTLFGNVAEDAAYGPNLLTMMIGANDFTGITDATYRNRLIALRSAYGSAREGMKVAWSPPLAYNPTGSPHPGKAIFDTQRASLLADCRDPAVWSQWADYYLPMGEHPDFGDPAVAAPLFGDSVHPSGAGQRLMFASYKAAMETLLDASRVDSDTMYATARPENEGNLPAGVRIKRRFIVSGLKHRGHAGGVAISGDGAPTIKVGGRDPAGPVYNGDVVDYETTLSASPLATNALTFTVGGDVFSRNFTTVAEVTPASAGTFAFAERVGGPNAVHTIGGVAFAEAGVGLIALNTLDGGAPTGVTFGGVAAELVAARSGYISIAVYAVPVTAGQTGPLVVTYPTGRKLTTVAYGTVMNADPAPMQAFANTTADGDYVTAPVTAPASGIVLGFFGQYGAGTAIPGGVAGAGNALVASGFGTLDNGEKVGLIVGRRSASGAVRFAFGPYGSFPVAVVAFKAAGT